MLTTYHAANLMPLTPAWRPAWKLFEQVDIDGVFWPRTLVHSIAHLKNNWSKDGRKLLLDITIEAGARTRGFNLFMSRMDAELYLPRFVVRGPQLMLCKVWARDVVQYPKAFYSLASAIYIDKKDWNARIAGKKILALKPSFT
jgi:hypothetical protein